MKKVLVVVDYQNDFITGALGFLKAKQLERPIYNRIAEALRDGYEIFFTLDIHDDAYLNTREGKHLPVMHCRKGSEGAKISGMMNDYLKLPQVHTVSKTSFGSRDLPIVMKEHCGMVDEIELCGVVTNLCVLSNAVILQNHFKNATIKINAELCASNDEAMHEKAIDVMRSMQFEII